MYIHIYRMYTVVLFALMYIYIYMFMYMYLHAYIYIYIYTNSYIKTVFPLFCTFLKCFCHVESVLYNSSQKVSLIV